MTRGKREPLEVRFWRNVQKGHGCWEWQGGTKGNGYGIIGTGVGKNSESAHRVSWELAHGEKPAGMVLHHCDNRLCVRPDHLYLGDAKSNIDDALKRGRFPIGEKHPNAKLTDDQVSEMRERFRHGENRTALAASFGISLRYLYQVCSEASRRTQTTK